MAIRKFLGVGAVTLATLIPMSADAQRAKEVCDAKTVAAYVDARRGDVKATCFDPHKNESQIPAEVKMTARVIYDAKGTVDGVSIVRGFQAQLSPCVVAKLRSWHPPCGPDKLDVDFAWRK